MTDDETPPDDAELDEVDLCAMQALGRITEHQAEVDALVNVLCDTIDKGVGEDAGMAFVVVEMVRAHLLDSVRRASDTPEDFAESCEFLARLEGYARDATDRSLGIIATQDEVGIPLTKGGEG